ASSQVVIALRDIANASSTNAQSVRNISDISEELLGMAQALEQLMQEFQQKHNN
ncbi:MAG: hypothetical protein GX665_04020, partial [Gammaproteobacteria bacterium]|nr:hypothetical protein [Gammaproteobacteria bacterium]